MRLIGLFGLIKKKRPLSTLMWRLQGIYGVLGFLG